MSRSCQDCPRLKCQGLILRTFYQQTMRSTGRPSWQHRISPSFLTLRSMSRPSSRCRTSSPTPPIGPSISRMKRLSSTTLETLPSRPASWSHTRPEEFNLCLTKASLDLSQCCPLPQTLLPPKMNLGVQLPRANPRTDEARVQATLPENLSGRSTFPGISAWTPLTWPTARSRSMSKSDRPTSLTPAPAGSSSASPRSGRPQKRMSKLLPPGRERDRQGQPLQLEFKGLVQRRRRRMSLWPESR